MTHVRDVDTEAHDQTDSDRWRAVLTRDPDADNRFWYSVSSTGIYCRPTCPSRRPRRDRVAFHRSAAAARLAGFRPCRRCRPDDQVPGARHLDRIVDACREIQNAPEAPTLSALAARSGLGVRHFHETFKRVVGLTPHQFAQAVRFERIDEALGEAATVTDAIYAAGFSASSRFYESAANRLGMTPTQRRRGGAGQTIRYRTADTWLGRVLVAATDRGICAITFGTDDAAVVDDLRGRFPAADLEPADDHSPFADWLSRALASIEQPTSAQDALPLDLAGTAFQERVWHALRAIPAGTTATYAQVASSIGQPDAARAVARACAANPAAVVIPCHRVIRSDGRLSGYRWGTGRKARLLAREAATTAGSTTALNPRETAAPDGP